MIGPAEATALLGEANSKDSPVRDSRPGRRLHLAASVVLFAGILLRVFQYLRRDSLWGDEAMVALSLGARSFRELLLPLDYGQVAPIPFVLGERLMILVMGMNEYALRFIPLLAGIGLLFLLLAIARRLLDSTDALIAIGLAAASTWLVRYSMEVKPYIIDAFVAALLIERTLVVLDEFESKAAWRWLALSGAIGAGVSLTSPFTIAGVLASLFLFSRSKERGGFEPRIVACGLIWLAVYAVQIASSHLSPGPSRYMGEYWEPGFLTPSSPHLVLRSMLALRSLLTGVSVWIGTPYLLPVNGLAYAVGIFSLRRRHGRPVVALLTAPLVALFIASIAGRFPLGTRLVLFTVPALILVLAPGLVSVSRRLLRMIPSRARFVTGTVFLVLAAALGVGGAFVPTRSEPTRLIVAHINERWRSGDAVYLFPRLVVGWTFYTTNWRQPDLEHLRWTARVAGLDGPAFANAASRGTRTSGQGRELNYPYRDGLALIGASSGLQFRLWTTMPGPDSGWATQEVVRIKESAHPCTWLALSHFITNPEGFDLIRAIASAGGAVTDGGGGPDLGVYLACFSGEGRPTGAAGVSLR